MRDYQVAIVGGGPAGLAAALTLSRSMISAVVCDVPDTARNRAASEVRGVAGRDLTKPAAFREAIASEITRYGYAALHTGTVSAVHRHPETGFELVVDDGTQFRARRLLLATGMIDVFPGVSGLDLYWGRSIIHCPFCDGFELKGRSWGVFANRPEMLEAAEVYRNWTDKLIMFVPGDVQLTDTRAQEIEARGIRIVRRAVVGVEGDGERLRRVSLDDGSVVDLDVLLIWPRQKQCPIVDALQPSLTASSYVAVDEGFRTSIDGVYAAGDLLYELEQNASTAIQMGRLAAVSIVFDICKQC